MSSSNTHTIPRLTSLSHGGGCGCKIAPAVLRDILQSMQHRTGFVMPPQLLVGIETADDAAVYQLNEHQALIATTASQVTFVGARFERHNATPEFNTYACWTKCSLTLAS